MNAILTNEYLDVCVQYEYLRRTSIKRAHQNITNMIKSHIEFVPTAGRRTRKRKIENGGDKGTPIKKARCVEEKSEERQNVDPSEEVMTAEYKDCDSDDSEIDAQTENSMDWSSYKIERVTDLYEKMATGEITQAMINTINNRAEMSGLDILNILSIRHVTRASLSDSIRPPIDILKVTVGCFKLMFNFYSSTSKEWNEIVYRRHGNGSMVSYGDIVRISEHKYQDSAAKDFIHLVTHPSAKIAKLEFNVEEYREYDSKIPPFDKFHRKIAKGLRTLNVKLHVKEWSMEYFKHENETSNSDTPMNLMSVWPFLKPGVLESIKIRRWNDDHLEYTKPKKTILAWKMFQDEQWKQAKHLDMDVYGFQGLIDNVLHFKSIRCRLTQKDFHDILNKMNSSRMERFVVHTDPDFDFDQAKKSDYKQNVRDSFFFASGLVMTLEESSATSDKRIVFSRRGPPAKN